MYAIGTKFTTRGKFPRECTVVDILRTYNYNGDLVSTRYVAVHKLNGQDVYDRNVTATTIMMGDPTASLEGPIA